MSFQGTWLGNTSGDWFGTVTLGSGIVVRIFKRISKARTERIARLNYTLTDAGGGLYTVAVSSGVSQDKVGSPIYEGYEFP